MQDWHYGESQIDVRGVHVSRNLIKTKNKNKALFQLITVNKLFLKIYYINRGPIFFEEISEEERLDITKFIFNKYNQVYKFQILKFLPNLEINSKNIFINQNKKLIFFKEPFWQSSVINLKNDISKIRGNFTGSIKNDLNFYNKIKDELNINIYDNIKNPFPIIKINHLKNLYLEEQKKKKFVGIKFELIENFIHKSNYKIYEVTHKETKQTIAFAFFYLHYPSATYLLGILEDSYKKYRPMPNILFRLIKDLKEDNYEYFDLGGIDNLNNKNVAFFKKKFSGQEYTLLGSNYLF